MDSTSRDALFVSHFSWQNWTTCNHMHTSSTAIYNIYISNSFTNKIKVAKHLYVGFATGKVERWFGRLTSFFSIFRIMCSNKKYLHDYKVKWRDVLFFTPKCKVSCWVAMKVGKAKAAITVAWWQLVKADELCNMELIWGKQWNAKVHGYHCVLLVAHCEPVLLLFVASQFTRHTASLWLHECIYRLPWQPLEIEFPAIKPATHRV